MVNEIPLSDIYPIEAELYSLKYKIGMDISIAYMVATIDAELVDDILLLAKGGITHFALVFESGVRIAELIDILFGDYRQINGVSVIAIPLKWLREVDNGTDHIRKDSECTPGRKPKISETLPA